MSVPPPPPTPQHVSPPPSAAASAPARGWCTCAGALGFASSAPRSPPAPCPAPGPPCAEPLLAEVASSVGLASELVLLLLQHRDLLLPLLLARLEELLHQLLLLALAQADLPDVLRRDLDEADLHPRGHPLESERSEHQAHHRLVHQHLTAPRLRRRVDQRAHRDRDLERLLLMHARDQRLCRHRGVNDHHGRGPGQLGMAELEVVGHSPSWRPRAPQHRHHPPPHLLRVPQGHVGVAGAGPHDAS
eukprot:32979-Hanusia_phi.AAC.2